VWGAESRLIPAGIVTEPLIFSTDSPTLSTSEEDPESFSLEPSKACSIAKPPPVRTAAKAVSATTCRFK
jgi:hypothetical protein